MHTFQRNSVIIPAVSLATSTPTAITNPASIPYANHAGGTVQVPASSTNTLLTWYESINGVNWSPLYDGSGNAVTSTLITSTLQTVPFPPQCAPCRFVTPVPNTATVVVNIALKS
jgi:hypothetical protein